MMSEQEHPPTPPPLPPVLKPSSLAMKVKAAPPGWFFESDVVSPQRDFFTPPNGPHFLYGTLQDPSMLVDILGLPSEPILRPAELVGYEPKLWGQYPALVKMPGNVVKGLVFDVTTVEHGEKLAAYETKNYRPSPCLIQYLDGKQPEQASGYTFLFDGNLRDLTEGQFDLKVWLKRMGRGSSETMIV